MDTNDVHEEVSTVLIAVVLILDPSRVIIVIGFLRIYELSY